MRALIARDGSVALDHARAAPIAGAGDVIIKLVRALATSSDAMIAHHAANQPLVLGRSFVGVVQPSRETAARQLVGKRVVGSSLIACGSCDRCMAGVSVHCRHRVLLGVTGPQGRDGCLADTFAMPARCLIAVPDAIDDDHAVFAAEIASAIHAVERLTVVGKPFVTILGDDVGALLMAQVMRRLNASVRIIGGSEQRMAACEKWGVKHRPTVETGIRGDQDVVIECTGTTQGLAIALGMLRPRGKVLLRRELTLQQSRNHADHAIDLSRIVRYEIEMIGSFHGPISSALPMLMRRELDVASLISRRLLLADGGAIVQAASQEHVLAVLVSP